MVDNITDFNHMRENEWITVSSEMLFYSVLSSSTEYPQNAIFSIYDLPPVQQVMPLPTTL